MADRPGEGSRSAQDNAPPRYDGFSGGVNPNPFPPSVLPNLRQPPRLDLYVTIAGQRYRQVDNGRADALVPAPLASPADLAQDRAVMDRALFMANNPVAATLYGAATLGGASPQQRDFAMGVGATADAAMLGASPFGARARSPVRPPLTRPPVAPLARDPIRYGPANASEQASGATASVTKPMINTGGRANRNLMLPGLLDNSMQDRSHLVAKGMGGTANTPEETMALHRWPNRGAMSSFEKQVIGRARRGEVVEYFVKPLYDAPASAPSSVVLSAQGSRGDFSPRIIPNVPSRPKK